MFFLFLLLLGGGTADADPVVYSTRFTGIEDETLRASLEALSDAANMEEEPPASLAHLRRRVQRDIGRFVKALQSAGYYGALVRAELREEVQPVEMIYEIALGPLYPFSLVEITTATGPEAHLPTPEAVGLATGEPATAERILDAEAKLLAALQENGHPMPGIETRDVIADHNTQSVEVRFVVSPGPEAVFGPARIEGLESVEASVVLRALPFDEGDPYKRSLVEAGEAALYKLNLFSTVQISTGEAVDAAGRVPMLVEVTERKHRTISGGVEYTSDFGAGINVRWEHRNIAGQGNRLTVETHLNKLLMDLRTQYVVPRYRRDDQGLRVDFEAAQEDTDAFESTRIVLRGWVQRELTEQVTVAVGAGLRLSEVEQFRQTDQYRLLSVAGRIEWDTTDNELDPTEGFRLALEIAPHVDIGGGDARFIRSELNLSHYWRLGDGPEWVLATRGRAGSIWAYPPRNIPPDLRFYAGGGGSVRGYPFQHIGPVVDDDPIGGRSVLEAAVELRKRFNDRLGMAVFVDAGMVYAPTTPEWSMEPRIGAGFGLRYFTPLGPLRLDLAVPLNPPDHVDAPFQIYLSIGQAF